MIRKLFILLILNLTCLVAADAVLSPQTVATLILDETKSMEARLEAVSVAGEGMIISCIPALIAKIDRIRSNVHTNELVPLSVTYPCVGALIQIGTPSIDPVLSALRLPQSALRQNLLREVVFQLEGEEGTRKYLDAIQSVNQSLPASQHDTTLGNSFHALSPDNSNAPPSKKRSLNKILVQDSRNGGELGVVVWPVWAVMIAALIGLVWLLCKKGKTPKRR